MDKLILQINSEEQNTANSDVFIDNYASFFLMGYKNKKNKK